jgi:hypothetical protein
MTANPTIRCRSFSLHKEGNAADEYEDAFASNPKSGRFAVADGASESSFAGSWAKLLVEGFVALRGRTSMDWIAPLQQRWAAGVDHLELNWYAEEKRQQGAFATFLGLWFKKPQEEKEARWKVLAVGDCCVFQVREDRLMVAFPVKKSTDFGNRPTLVGSRSLRNGSDPLAAAQHKLGRWKPGDRFFLMTDALAEWFLKRHEEQRKPWESLLRRLDEPKSIVALTGYVEQLRRQRELNNDDVTLLVVEL